jgi:two-component sensor histidine kinase
LTVKARTKRGLDGDGAAEYATGGARTREVTIEVANDGNGLPKDFDPEKNAHLGLNIVRTLVNSDMRGRFKIAPGPGGQGVVATITFTPTLQAQ